MFWDKKDKKPQTLHEFYQDKKYTQDYNWIDYYRPNRKRAAYGWGTPPRRQGPVKRAFYRVAVVLSILGLLFYFNQLSSPISEDIRAGLRYVLTTDWDLRPAMEKAVKFGLQAAGVDSQLDSGLPQEGMLRETTAPASVFKGMALPVSGKVVREYGWNKDPLDGMDRFHPGIDIAAAQGTPVKAVLPGKVIKVGSSPQYGRYVLIDHNDGAFTLYAGLGNIKVSEGRAVKTGEVVGDIAKTGDVEGGGLHFEMREKGSFVDPLTRLEFPPVK
ncbi:MAG: M23 family metallopeptidase [Peptococcaceae bacterium]|nr:M23 family metallopeptidase [Peptococcaceae bacterium]